MPAVEIDPSIILKAQAPQFDALGTASKAVALGQGMLNNRLVQQQVQGKEAVGRAVTRAQDPNTGEIDWSKAQAYVGADPTGAFALPEFGKSVIDRQTAEQQQIKARADAALAKLGLSEAEGKYISAGFTPFIQKFSTPAPGSKEPPVPTPEDLQSAINDIVVAAGENASPNLLKRAASLSQQATTTDPRTFLDRVKGLSLMGNPSPENIAMIYGPVANIETGAGTAITRTPGLGGPTSVVSVVDKQLSPSEENTPAYTYRDAQGVEHIVTKREAAAAAAGGHSPVGIASGAPFGTEAAATGTANTAVELAKGWVQQAEQAPERIAQIKNLRDQVGKFTAGPQASWLYKLKALATMAGVAVPGVKDEVAAQEEFAKLAQQFINSNTQQLGDGTDSKLASAMKASPNEFLSNQGVTGVLALMEGLEAAKMPKATAWQKWLDAGNPPTSAQKFQTEWNRVYNPRVFQSAYMEPAQRASMLKKMSPKERDQFQKDWVFAKKAGWLP